MKKKKKLMEGSKVSVKISNRTLFSFPANNSTRNLSDTGTLHMYTKDKSLPLAKAPMNALGHSQVYTDTL